MRIPEVALAGDPWMGVLLLQVTLVAAVGVLAWLLARRGGPALRGAVVLAALVGLLLVPGFASVAPVWLPLPETSWLGVPRPEPAGQGHGVAAPPLPTDGAALAAATSAPAGKPPGLEGLMDPDDELFLPPEAGEPVVVTAGMPSEDVMLPSPSGEPSDTSWSLSGVLTVVWLVGAIILLTRALLCVALLYHWARRARPIREPEWAACLESLAEQYGLSAVALRESPAVGTALTLGLFHPIVLLPPARRAWLTEQRRLVLAHELAHVQRRDFLAGLVAELAACLCWFHPLVHFLAGRLRLEQEYAADAWAASAASDARDYVRCLARLALELSQGRASLAPAFWRRRPEILRRIDMLRRNPHRQPARLGTAAAWSVAGLTVLTCAAIAGVGPLRSAAEEPQPSEARLEANVRSSEDIHGDPLPAGALARMGTIRWRHGGAITFVAFGPEGKTVITAGQDGTVRLWDLATGKEIRRFAQPKSVPEPLPARNAAAQQLQAAEKAAIEAKLAQLRLMPAAGSSMSVAVAPDGKTVAVAAAQIVQFYDVETGKEVRKLDRPGTGVAGLNFSPDGRVLAGRGSDGSIFFWETDTGKELRRIKVADQPEGRKVLVAASPFGTDTSALAFSPDGKALAAPQVEFKDQMLGSALKCWDVASGKQRWEVKMPGRVGVSSLAFAPAGNVLAYGSPNGAVTLCAADTGKEIRQIKTPDGALSLAFAPDGKALAVGGRAQQVRLWDPETGKELHQLAETVAARVVATGVAAVGALPARPEIRNIAFAPDGTRLVTASGHTLRVWDPATGKELPLSDGHRGLVSAVTLTPDGKSLISWGADHVLRRWEAATGKALDPVRTPAGSDAVAFAPDGRIVAVTNADGSIRLVEIATGKELRKLAGPPNGISSVAFSPDGKTLAAEGGGNVVRLYDVTTGRELRILTAQAGNHPALNDAAAVKLAAASFPLAARTPLVFSPDGRLLAASSPVAAVPGARNQRGGVSLFDVGRGKELRRIEPSQQIVSIAFSPDGRTLAAENADQTFTLWEVASGRERDHLGKKAVQAPPGGALAVRAVNAFTNFAPPAGPVTLAFSPDGRALATRGPDRTVRVWDVMAGKELTQLKGHEGQVETVAFAADGRTIFSGSADTTVLLWDAAAPMKDLSVSQVTELTPDAVLGVWNDLAGEDAGKAMQGIGQLAGSSKQAVAFLSKHLKPAVTVEEKKLERWIGDLESEKFSVRQEATANLLKVGEQAIPALRQVLTRQPAIETRKRVEELLDKLAGGRLSTAQLRLIRAVEALERMGTPEARQLLQALAEGAPGALPTMQAQAALERLAAR